MNSPFDSAMTLEWAELNLGQGEYVSAIRINWGTVELDFTVPNYVKFYVMAMEMPEEDYFRNRATLSGYYEDEYRGADLSQPDFEKIQGYASSERTLLKWSWNESFSVGKTVYVFFKAKIGEDTPEKEVHNEVQLTTNTDQQTSQISWYKNSHPNDLDGDEDVEDLVVTYGVNLNIKHEKYDMRTEKVVVNPKNYIPGDTLTYRAKVQNSKYAIADFPNPIFIDLLPSELYYVEGSWKIGNVSGNPITEVANPSFEIIENYNSTGRTLLRWKWEGGSQYSLYPKEKLYVFFDVKIKDGTQIGSISNEISLTTNTFEQETQASTFQKDDDFDLDGDENLTDLYVRVHTNIQVVESVALDSVKWVRIADIAITEANGTADYKLIVTNIGNVDANEISIIDILPHIGHKGVLVNGDRGSQWTPELAILKPVLNGGTVYYSYATDPVRDGINPGTIIGTEEPNWTSNPEDLSKVRSLKFDFGDKVLKPSESLELEWSMEAPNGVSPGEVAWNSFAYYYSNANSSTRQLAAEPPKVGFQIKASTDINLDKTVYLGHDGGKQIGSEFVQGSIGDPVTYMFTIFNPGHIKEGTQLGTDLNHIKLEDVNLGINLSDMILKSGTPDRLKISESLVYFYETTLTKDMINTATVTGNPVNEKGEDIPYLQKPKDTDTAEVKVLGVIGDKVWEDINDNGIRENGEEGISDVIVKLFDKEGKLLKSIKTDADGNYIFEGLIKGYYKVEFSLKNGYRFTSTATGSDITIDSNADTAIGETTIVVLGSGEKNLTIDDGMHKILNDEILPASLGDYVWKDTNRNGIQDDGEEAVINITIKLLNENRDLLLSTTTDNNGRYIFKDLEPGKYIVSFQKSEDRFFTGKNMNGNDEKDSDVDQNTGETELIELLSGESNMTIDAGIITSEIKIEKTVYKGHNDGVGIGEELVIGKYGVKITCLFKVTNTGDVNLNNIEVKDENLGIDKSDMTLLKGKDLLNPGEILTYYYETTITGDLLNTATTKGTPSDEEGNEIPNAKKVTDDDTAKIKKVTEEMVRYAAVGDFVWNDKNFDGIQDKDEYGIQDIRVILTDAWGNTTETLTDESGKYLFSYLSQGKYTITIDETTLPYKVEESFALDGTLDNTVKIELQYGELKDDVDFGYSELIDIPFGSGKFLPKTGSPIDFVMMIIIGLFMLLVGTVIIVFVSMKKSKKTRRKNRRNRRNIDKI